MDERQQRIREGAGLEESRLNIEFIDWLRRWSTPLLLVAAAIALGVVVRDRWQRSQVASVNRAFSALEAAIAPGNPSPESLRSLADEWDGTRAVPHIARLHAADTLLKSVRMGVKPGSALNSDGTAAEADVLTEEDRTRNLGAAESLYSRVVTDTRDKPGQELLAIQGLYGLAAVAETRGDADAARAKYQDVSLIADRAGFTAHVALAKKRTDALATLGPPAKLYAAADLPKLPWTETPRPPEQSGPIGPEAPPEALPTGEGQQPDGGTPPAEGTPPPGDGGDAPTEQKPQEPQAPPPEEPSDPK